MENTWPSLKGWNDIPDTVGTRRAIYGKVHRAPTDYRWIGWSAGFGSAPTTREQELVVDTRELPAVSIGWRCAPATGPFALRFYSSRAFDAAGRPGGVEKQILAPFPETGASIPPVALAFLLLDAAAPFDDTIWWDTWRNPAWASMTHSLAIGEQDCPQLRIGQLESKIEQGLAELLEGVDESSLVRFYSQLLAGTSPSVLATKGELLSPLAMAALLLPLERSQTEQLSIAGGVVAPAIDPANLAKWDQIDPSKMAAWNRMVCTLDAAAAEPQAPGDAIRLVGLLKLGNANGGQLPTPPSLGGSYVESFLGSEGRWLAPGTLGTEALRTLGPWPTVKSPREAARLRTSIEDFRDYLMTLTAPECDPDEFHHKATKLELLQALLVVLCPGPETYRIFDQNQSHYVPALYFIGRIEPEDWEDFAGRYTLEQFLDLAHHSLHAARIPALSEAVWDFLEDQRTRDQSSLMARYAGGALRAAGA